MFSSSELVLIRHAEPDNGGRLCGRTDIGLVPEASIALSAMALVLPAVENLWVSPARRCRDTLAGLWPGKAAAVDARLWEQNFGMWDGEFFDNLPDVGELSRDELAALAGPGGESFVDMVGRVTPALEEMAELARSAAPIVVVAHAGTVRAALSMALGDVAAGLAFEVDPLSMTRFRCSPGGELSIVAVNRREL